MARLVGVILLTRGHLEMSGDLLVVITGCTVLALREIGAGMLLNILQCTGQALTSKNYLVQKVSCGIAEKPWAKGRLNKRYNI